MRTRMRRLVGAVLAVMPLVLLTGASPAPLPSKALFDGADPDALFVGDTMWIYPTGRGPGHVDRFNAWSSTDLANWTMHPDLLRINDIAWIKADGAPVHHLWAPSMLAAGGRYYLYYAVGPQKPTPSRIGVATCKGPAGPCVDSGKPLVTGGQGFEAIDPMVFVDPRSHVPYLYAGGSAGATLHVYELTPDLLTVKRQLNVKTPPNFTEGAFMHYRDGIYYLSYSHGRYNADSYSVHYATAKSPTGPWDYKGPILQTDATYKGPGHHAFIQDPRDGSWMIVYHRWEDQSGHGPYKGSRKVAIAHFRYNADGTIKPIDMEAP